MASTKINLKSQRRLINEINDITECSICSETMKDPRCLPCLHSFCFECLKNYTKGKLLGENNISCPLCRKVSKLEANGIEGLPVSHFINKIIDAAQLEESEENKTLCEICFGLGVEEAASDFCLECNEDMCSGCTGRHAIQKSTKQHKTVKIDDKPSKCELEKMTKAHCSEHQTEEVKLYCYDCRKLLCVVCYVSGHISHNCNDIKKAVDDVITKVNEVGDKIKKSNAQITNDLKDISISQTDLKAQCETVRDSLRAKFMELKNLLDENYKKSYEELAEIQSKRKTELDTLKEQCECDLAAVQDIANLWAEIKTNGSPSDILETGDKIYDRFQDINVKLEKENSVRNARCKTDFFKAEFVPSPCHTEWNIGEILHVSNLSPSLCPDWTVVLDNPQTKALTKECESAILGLILLEGCCLTVTSKCDFIYAYNLEKPQINPIKIRIPDVVQPVDISYSNTGGNLFIVDRGRGNVESGTFIRINVKGRWLQISQSGIVGLTTLESALRAAEEGTASQISYFVDKSSLITETIESGKPISLSATENGHILVCVSRDSVINNYGNAYNPRVIRIGNRQEPIVNAGCNNWIMEYDTNGAQVRKFSIEMRIDHVVKLSNGYYAGCSSLPKFEAFIFDDMGRVINRCSPVNTNQGSTGFTFSGGCSAASAFPSRIYLDKIGNNFIFNPSTTHLYILQKDLTFLGPFKSQGMICFEWDGKLQHLIAGSNMGSIHAILPKT